MKNRKIKRNKIFKIGILFLGISLLLWNCEKDELIYSETEKFHIIEFNQISKKIQNSIPEIKSISNPNSKKLESKQNISYNFEEVVKLVDSIGNIKFTIEFNIKEQPANVFYNLVIGEDEQGKILNPLVFKYTINNYIEYLEELKFGHLKLEGEKEILDYYLFKDSYSNSNKSINYSAKPCGGNTEPVLWDSNYYTEGFWWEEWETRKTYIVWEEEGAFEFPKNRKTRDCGGSTTNGSYATIINSDKCPTGYFRDIDTDECVAILVELDLSDTEKIDPKEELKCFDISNKAKLTIYVQQPRENTADIIGPNSVGHAFIGLEQNGFIRNIGFYPIKDANRGLVAVGRTYDSEIRTNNNYMYHVSISREISSSQLNSITEYIKNAPNKYNVNSYACADFAIEVGNLGNLSLPSTTVSNLTFSGRSPGQLGQEIRERNSNNEVTVSKTKGNSPDRSGNCN